LVEATASHLVVPVPTFSGPGVEELDIRHILIREAIVGTLPGLRRRELHGRLAAALERRPSVGDGDDVERTSTLARHWLLAGEDRRALPMLLREATSAEQAHAFSTAAQAYRLALDTWARIEAGEATAVQRPGRPSRDDVLERAAHASSLAGRPADAVAFTRSALGTPPASSPATDPERWPRLTMHLGRFLAEAGQPQEALTALDAACSSADAGPLLRARSLTSLSRLLLSLGRAPEAVDRAGQAVRLLEELRDGSVRRALAQARTALATALAGVGRMGEAMAALHASAQAPGRDTRSSRPSTSSRPSRIVADLQSYLDRAVVLEGSGDLVAAAQAAEEGLRLAQSRGLAATHGAVLAATAAWDRIQVGDWDAAEELLGSLDLDAEAPAEVRLVRGRLAALRGQWQRAESELAGVGPEDSTMLERGWVAVPALVAVEMAYWRRHWLDARASVRRGVESAASAGEHGSLMVLALLGLRVEADAVDAGARRRLAAGSAARDLAAEYWIRIRASAGRDPVASPPRQRAVVASAEAESTRLSVVVAGGRPDRSSVAAWQRAVSAWDAAGDPYEAAYCRWRLAEAHVVGRGDREAARDLLGAAVATAGRLGAEPLAREIEALARRARLVPVGRAEADGLPERAGVGESHARELGLSRRETEVLRLIAEGLSDRDIGERLFITTKTAGHHVSHILAKLGLDRRGEAAVLAFRIGLVDQPR
jgi:DNA-binding CsgD family transcriptional regulator/tetratricopeptide (TPR) repeat protein